MSFVKTLFGCEAARRQAEYSGAYWYSARGIERFRLSAGAFAPFKIMSWHLQLGSDAPANCVAAVAPFRVGEPLIWIRANTFTATEPVVVVELRSRGQARLSNGWTVDEDGYADGTRRVVGGRVVRATSKAST